MIALVLSPIFSGPFTGTNVLGIAEFRKMEILGSPMGVPNFLPSVDAADAESIWWPYMPFLSLW